MKGQSKLEQPRQRLFDRIDRQRGTIPQQGNATAAAPMGGPGAPQYVKLGQGFPMVSDRAQDMLGQQQPQRGNRAQVLASAMRSARGAW